MSRLRVFILVGGGVLAGCTQIPVRTDQDAQLLASVHCQSYGWAGGFKGESPLRNSIANPLNESRLRDAIAADLQIAGKVLAGAATTPAVSPAPGAQCLIGYGIGMQRQVDAVYPEGWGYGRAFWGPGWGPGWGWGEPYIYHQSFISLDVYDAASRKPLWHASAETSLTGLTGDAAAQRIRAAVDAIFLKFPK
ncbi:MAG: DUF4136 domain-containing protein [Steroidobacteraceae bacterium]